MKNGLPPVRLRMRSPSPSSDGSKRRCKTCRAAWRSRSTTSVALDAGSRIPRSASARRRWVRALSFLTRFSNHSRDDRGSHHHHAAALECQRLALVAEDAHQQADSIGCGGRVRSKHASRYASPALGWPRAPTPGAPSSTRHEVCSAASGNKRTLEVLPNRGVRDTPKSIAPKSGPSLLFLGHRTKESSLPRDSYRRPRAEVRNLIGPHE
jgi:hypothetical protein